MPPTQTIDARQALETLAYAEMIALAQMFDRWIHSEPVLPTEQREKASRLSSDYYLIAAYAGENWTATNPGTKVDAMQFVARKELECIANPDRKGA